MQSIFTQRHPVWAWMCLHGMLLRNSQYAINSHHPGPQHSTTHTACCRSLQQNSNIEVGQETAQRNSGQHPCIRKIHRFFSYMDLLTRGFWIWNGGLKETWKFLQSSNSWSSRNYGEVPCSRQPESHCESITASCESRVSESPKWEHVDGKTCKFYNKNKFPGMSFPQPLKLPSNYQHSLSLLTGKKSCRESCREYCRAPGYQ